MAADVMDAHLNGCACVSGRRMPERACVGSKQCHLLDTVTYKESERKGGSRIVAAVLVQAHGGGSASDGIRLSDLLITKHS